jgi:hypothetical protein
VFPYAFRHSYAQRQAWDGEPLQTIVRNDPLRVTEPHIGIVGHISRDELLRYLTATELANGFANRFLLIGVERSKLLPFGGALDGQQFAEGRDAVRLALRFARGRRENHSNSHCSNDGGSRESTDT